MFSRKSRALRRPWVWGCGPSSRGHRYWGVPGQGPYVGCDDPAHPWNGHHHEGGVSGYRLRIQGPLPTLAARVGSQELPKRAGVASHAHCIGRYARTAAIRRLQNYEITRLRSYLTAGLADCLIAHSGNPKIYNSCNPPIRPPSLHHQQPNPRHQQRHHRLRRRRPLMATGEAGAFRPSHPQAWRSGPRRRDPLPLVGRHGNQNPPRQIRIIENQLIGHHPATGQVWSQVVEHPDLVDILEWKRDPETSTRRRASSPSHQYGYQPQSPNRGGNPDIGLPQPGAVHPYSDDPQITGVAGSRIARVGDRRSGRPTDCQSEGLTEFVTFSAVSTWSVSADIRMRKNAEMVLTHPMVAASSADIPWRCVRQIAKGGCQGRRQNVPLGRCPCSRIGPYSHWPVQSKIQGPG